MSAKQRLRRTDPRRYAYLSRLGTPDDSPEWDRQVHGTDCNELTCTPAVKAHDRVRAAARATARRLRDKVRSSPDGVGWNAPGGARGVRLSSRTRRPAPPPPLFRDSTGELRRLRPDERLKVVRLRVKGEREWMTPQEYARFDFKAWRRIRDLIKSGALEAVPLEDVPIVRTGVYDKRLKARPEGEPVRVPLVATDDERPLRVSIELLGGQVNR